jgi:Domain found in Dishevelled, Egl-10, and Pleckstrin (DEP)
MMAMKVLPQDILPSVSDLGQLAQQLHEDSNAVAFIDLSGMRSAVPHMLALAQLLATAQARGRVILLHENTGVWATDVKWANELGFAGLVAQTDAVSLGTDARSVLDTVARLTWTAAIEPGALTRYFSAMQITSTAAGPRPLIRKATGLSAEALCAAIASSVKALDRTYRLKSYPSCFLGSDAVSWLAKQYGVAADQAVALGAALQSLGMLHHVTHEQPFANTPNFFRTNLSTAADRQPLGALLKVLSSKAGVQVKDRTYLNKLYPACFVGSEAVDWLTRQSKVKRHDAEIILNRLYRLNMIEHVAHAHEVRDGLFFYRFI